MPLTQPLVAPTGATPAGETASPPRSATPPPTIQASTPTITPSSVSSVTATPLSATAPTSLTVRLHPDGPLYVGDQVSLEILAPEDGSLDKHTVRVEFGDDPDAPASEEQISSFGIGGRSQATFWWAWDTSALPAGEHRFSITILPSGPSWTETVSLSPQSDLPPPEPNAHWATAESDCCLAYYISGTPGERDLNDLLDMADAQAGDAKQRLGIELAEPVQITFLPRVLGHGGFASQDISISYLDRNYAGGSSEFVLHHEIIHILDGRLGGELRPTMFVEGLAVYLTGGHFKPEPLLPRAAALRPPGEDCIQASEADLSTDTLLAWSKAPDPAIYISQTERAVCGTGWYIPMYRLADNFYFEQHEIGYLQAASLIEYMVDTWGWNAFSAFYRDIHNPQGTASPEVQNLGSQGRAIDAALRMHFGISLAELDKRFQAALLREPLTVENAEDVRLTVAYYDSVRRYQKLLDPSAYFLSAWLPDNQKMRQRGIVADYLRRPSQDENLAIEVMLVAADKALRSADYGQVSRLLNAVNQTLDGVETDAPQPFAANPLAQEHLNLVQAIRSAGFQPQQVLLANEKEARVRVSTTGPDLIEQDWVKQQGVWTLSAD